MGRHPSDIVPPQKVVWGPDAGLPTIIVDTNRKDNVRILIGPTSGQVRLTRDTAVLYLERLANAIAWLGNVEALHALQDETGGTSDG